MMSNIFYTATTEVTCRICLSTRTPKDFQNNTAVELLIGRCAGSFLLSPIQVLVWRIGNKSNMLKHVRNRAVHFYIHNYILKSTS